MGGRKWLHVPDKGRGRFELWIHHHLMRSHDHWVFVDFFLVGDGRTFPAAVTPVLH